jgi:hypothetical protein
MVIEEFGLPRNEHSFDVKSATSLRDEYYSKIFEFVAEGARTSGHIAGANFWAFGGTSRPVKNQLFWKKGDDYMGDPPMEELGLNTVFDSDKTTWAVINNYSKMLRRHHQCARPATGQLAPLRVEQMRHQRQPEGERLARSGGCGDRQVDGGAGRVEHGVLDGRQVGEAARGKCPRKRCGQAPGTR